jgi:small subunit ribosomal protein S2
MKVSMKDLLEAGVHFGHQTRRWNPKMKPYIFTERNDIYIIDLQHTLEKLKEAYEFVRDLAGEGGIIMFVGTKRQAQDAFEEHAQRCEMPYVTHRWLGGMLTNFNTIASRLDRLAELEEMKGKGDFETRPKKEVMRLEKELLKLQRNLGGIRGMERLPDALFIIDTKKEEIAVREAHKLNIPIVAVVDTNCDPDEVDFPVPGNDDAIRSAALIARVIADAVVEGREMWLSKQAEIAEEATQEVKVVDTKIVEATTMEAPVEEAVVEAKKLSEETAAELSKKEASAGKEKTAKEAVKKPVKERKEKAVEEKTEKKTAKKKTSGKKKEVAARKSKSTKEKKTKAPKTAEKSKKKKEEKGDSQKKTSAKTRKSTTKKDSKKTS